MDTGYVLKQTRSVLLPIALAGIMIIPASGADVPTKITSSVTSSPDQVDFGAALNHATIHDTAGDGVDNADIERAAAAVVTAHVDGVDIGRGLARSDGVKAASYVLMGERHRWVPAGIITGLTEGLVEEGRQPVLAVELPPANRSGQAVLADLAQKVNANEISYNAFGTALVQAFRTDPDLRGFLAEDEDNVAGIVQMIVQAARVGAKISFVDMAYFATPEQVGAANDPRIRRDAVMADAMASLHESSGPNAVVIFSGGLAHTQERARMAQVDASAPPTPFAVDLTNPTGHRLADRFGADAVFSVATFGTSAPLFVKGTPADAWDLMLHEPDGTFLPDWLD